MTALLHAAAMSGHTFIVKALLEAGAYAGHLDEVCVCEQECVCGRNEKIKALCGGLLCALMT
jgi:hypothetical protein